MLRISFFAIITLFFASITTIVSSAATDEMTGPESTEEYIQHMRNVSTLNVFVDTDAGVLHCAE